MAEASTLSSLSLLDVAHGKWLAGDRDGALRQALAVLHADVNALSAAALVSTILIAAHRPFVAGEAAARIADGFIRRGDLPGAAAAACLARAAEEDPAPLRRSIAAAFGRGSPRIGDSSAAPPPLPKPAPIPAPLARLAGEPLLDKAEESLQAFLSREDPHPANAPLPRLPLVGELAPPALEKWLASLAVRDVAQDQPVVREGEEGNEAFLVVRGFLRVARKSAEQPLAVLGPGAIFGEMALVSDAPRAASVFATEPTQLLVMTRPELETLAKEAPEIGKELGRFCHQRMVSNLIRHSEILSAVEPAERQRLMSRFAVCTFKTGQALVKQGEEAEGLFLIASGTVLVTSKDAEGDKIELAKLGPGDVVGEISLVLRRPATADVTAAHPTVALELKRKDFQEAIREHPNLLGQLYELATARDEQTRSVVAQQALDVDDIVLV